MGTVSEAVESRRGRAWGAYLARLDVRSGTSATLLLAALAAALAPAYVVRYHVGFYPTTLLEAALLVTLAAFGVLVLTRGTVVAWRSPLTVPVVLFLVAGAASVLTAPSRVAALGLYRAYLIEPVLFALVLVSIVGTPSRARLVLGGFWVGAAVLAVANVDVVGRALLSHRFRIDATPLVAVYTVSNAVALYLVPLIAAAGALLLHERDRLVRAVAAAFLALAVPATLLTFSRGGWLATGAVAIGLALSHRRRWLLLAGIAAVGVALLLVPAITQRIALDLRLEGGETFQGRIGIWAASLQMLLHRPIFGAGLSGFAQRMGPGWAHLHQGVVIYPHNIVLNFWSETGLLGLIAFAWIFAVTAFVSWRGWRRGAPAWRPLHLGVLLALVAVLVHGLVDVPYFKNDLSVEFWGLAALTFAGRRAGS